MEAENEKEVWERLTAVEQSTIISFFSFTVIYPALTNISKCFSL